MKLNAHNRLAVTAGNNKATLKTVFTAARKEAYAAFDALKDEKLKEKLMDCFPRTGMDLQCVKSAAKILNGPIGEHPEYRAVLVPMRDAIAEYAGAGIGLRASGFVLI